MYRIARGDGGVHVVVNVTPAMKTIASKFRLRIQQTSPFSYKHKQSWAVDNFVVLGKGPEVISDNFDFLNSCTWLTNTAKVKVLTY